jgi:NTE family protein
LYDGGLYDNLGLEPLFDMGKQCAKFVGGTLIVSDAGAPLTSGFDTGMLNPLRMKRWFELATDQQRSLRVRSFIHALRNGLPGAYLQIGSPAIDRLKEASCSASSELIWLTAALAGTAASCTTSLSRLSVDMFDLLSRHGYETAHWNSLAFPYY